MRGALAIEVKYSIGPQILAAGQLRGQVNGNAPHVFRSLQVVLAKRPRDVETCLKIMRRKVVGWRAGSDGE